MKNNIKKIDFLKIDNKFIYWNNKQSKMPSEKIAICTYNWIVK